jgi:imidazolonepropionase-like amidohydrolase
VAIVGGNVFTGTAWRTNTTILIEDSLITAVGDVAIPADAERLDAAGRFVIPGLIDTHVHVATDPDGEDTRDRTLVRLRAALLGGVTSVREMAGDARRLAGYARDAAVTDAPMPDLYFTALFAGPDFFMDPRTHSSARGEVAGAVPWMRAVTDSTDFPRVVAEAKGTGATALKLYARLDSTAAARAIAEAHRQGLLVWAHAWLGPATPSQLVGAGVDAVSHASLLARAMTAPELAAFQQQWRAGDAIMLQSPSLDSVLRLMAARKVMFDPTLFVYGDNAGLQVAAGAVTRRAHELGVLISTGTDSIGSAAADAVPNVHEEIALLVRLAGFTPAEALVAATANGARTLGLGDRTGVIAPGRRADLVLLRQDPLQDIRNTRSVELVLKRGVIFRR